MEHYSAEYYQNIIDNLIKQWDKINNREFAGNYEREMEDIVDLIGRNIITAHIHQLSIRIEE